jgi:glucoamylase
MATVRYTKVGTIPDIDPAAVAPVMRCLMMRNMATSGTVFIDPHNGGDQSQAGAILASPSSDLDGVGDTTQDYVYNWVRDSAIVAMEISYGSPQATPSQHLNDYVTFAKLCQGHAPQGAFSRAAFQIDGLPRQWSEQNDGPALQTLAILQAYGQLNQGAQSDAIGVIEANLDFLLGANENYKLASVNLWEEVYGQSFFTRSVQLRCLREIDKAIGAGTIAITRPANIGQAIADLESYLATHWNGTIYESVPSGTPAGQRPVDLTTYDPNIDIVMASVYGAVPCTDTKLLATAAAIRKQWADPTSDRVYPINTTDPAGIGPLIGRYPGDTYDGENWAPAKGHPWAVCTASFAELYYNLASAVGGSTVPYDDLSSMFFSQVGITENTSPAEAAAALRAEGDRMLKVIIYHSDHLSLSEQFDAVTGYEKSVHDLTWSYASFLSAVRARTSVP